MTRSRKETTRKAGRVGAVLRRFLRDDAGGAAIDYVLVFTPLMGLTIFVTQVGTSYFQLVSAQDGAQRAARLAATLPIAHCGALRNSENGRVYELDDDAFAAPPATTLARACLNDPSPCLPLAGAWTCTADLATQGVCDDMAFQAVYDAADIPGVAIDRIELTYEDSRMGEVEGPVVPLVTVTVHPRALDIRNLLFDDVVDVPSVSATALGEAVGRGKWEGPSC